MNALDPAPRRQIYSLLIVIAAGMALGRILSAELVYEPSYHRAKEDPPEKGREWPKDRPRPMPTFSSNDRSRWCTVRALVDVGTFVIGKRDPSLITRDNKFGDTGIVFEDGWKTVDKVMNPITREFYSTKPPLLPVLMAGEYWLLKHALGWEIEKDTDKVVRTIVVTFNLLPWLLYLLVLSKLIERFGTTDWGRLYVLAAACFGTMMTPFVTSINNHTIGTCSALFALYFASKVWTEENPKGWSFALAGFFAAFTVTNELPALAFAVGLGVLLLFRNAKQTLLWFVPVAAIPLGALLLTNYLAMGELQPAYSKFGGPWYQYEGSHWARDPNPIKPGIDFARTKEGMGAYAFHVLLGHHGLFSLMPVMLLALAGMIVGTRRLASGVSHDPGAGSGVRHDPGAGTRGHD